jgi:hypothetical protein
MQMISCAVFEAFNLALQTVSWINDINKLSKYSPDDLKAGAYKLFFQFTKLDQHS